MVYTCTEQDLERAAERLTEAIRSGKVKPVGSRLLRQATLLMPAQVQPEEVPPEPPKEQEIGGTSKDVPIGETTYSNKMWSSAKRARK